MISSISFLVFYLASITETLMFISFNLVWLALSMFLGLNAWSIKKRNSESHYHVPVVYYILLGIFTVVSIPLLVAIRTPVIDQSVHTPYVIVLGGGVKRDGTLPKTVQLRLKGAIDYLESHEQTAIIVTGGQFPLKDFSEAELMEKYLQEHNIPVNRIIREDQSQDTIQNLKYSAQIIADRENISMEEALDTEITIATSFFHLHRAQILARRLGFTGVYGIGSPLRKIDVPTAYLREIGSYIKLGLRILITGEPRNMQANTIQ